METLEEINREGKARLYPSLTNPSWLVLRERREIFKKWVAGLPDGRLAVLDIGGRIQPYRPLLEGRVRSYVTVDLRQTPLVNVVGLGERIPLASERFDLVICTQMLEYAPEPGVVIAEIHRVLKPGGCLMLSAPAIFPRDSEHDAWRFMPQSLKVLLRSFSQVEILPEGTSIAGFVRTACVCLPIFARPVLVAKLLQCTLVPGLNLAAFCLEALFPNSNDQFTANFSALARK